MSDIIDLSKYRKKHHGFTDAITREIAADIESTLDATTGDVSARIKRIEATHFNLSESDLDNTDVVIEK